MARDYAKTRSSGNNKNKSSRSKPAAKRKQKQPQGLGVPGWVWLFCGLCLGLVIAAAVYLTRPAGQAGLKVTEMQLESATPTSDKANKPPASKKNQKNDQQPRFEFYEMLPNYEVIIPGQINEVEPDETNVAANDAGNVDTSSQEVGSAPNPEPEPQVQAPGPYIVQAGSFSAYQRADRLRARIALLGIPSEIHKAQLADGQTVYRVRTKLIEGADSLTHILEKLHNNGIRTLVLHRSS